jgi:hypothetical protein
MEDMEMKVLSPKAHAPVDYAIVALFVLAPTIFNFGGLPATLTYCIAALHLGMTLITDFPGGLLKALPFTVHGNIELVTSFTLMALPFLLGFADVEAARNLYLISGVAVLAVWAMTDYKAEGAMVGDSVKDMRETAGTRR